MINLVLTDDNKNLLLLLNKFKQPFGSYKFNYVNSKNNKTAAVLTYQGGNILYFVYGNKKYNFKINDQIIESGKLYAVASPDNFTYEEFKLISGLEIVGFNQ